MSLNKVPIIIRFERNPIKIDYIKAKNDSRNNDYLYILAWVYTQIVRNDPYNLFLNLLIDDETIEFDNGICRKTFIKSTRYLLKSEKLIVNVPNYKFNKEVSDFHKNM